MTNEKELQTIEQGRAKYAFECAQEGKKLSEASKYKSYVKKTPMLIKNNGLGAAFAFIYQNKKEKPYELIYNQTYRWLSEYRKYVKKDEKNTLMAQLVSMSSEEYCKITNEVMALFNWLRRFVDAEIE
ncbi:MAG: type III-B CRISPR module-associated protein Cmr5 [Bacteroidia bacterium]|nr:type III-B CRISPR module-associated protein Cmr5 [Bacteroidia bacterium]MDW8157469.1 type III-B CRISPR module-associated protein Cmr5 [Bacteroidia bacterium]